MKIKDIKLNPDNPREISADKFEKLTKSIKGFEKMMELRPIVIDETKTVLGGNMRLKALAELGYKDVPDNWIKQAKDLTEDEKREFVIKDNNSFGQYDWEALANGWDDLPLTDWGVDIPEDWITEPEALEEDEDAVSDAISKADELKEKWQTAKNQLWQCGEHRILCGDSTKKEDVERLMDGEKAEMVFTDPPYGYEYESNHQSTYKVLENDNVILDFIPNLIANTKKNTPFYVCGAWQTIDQWRFQILNNNLKLKNIIIWKKNNWSMGDLKGAYAGQYEMILFAHKGRVELTNGRDRDVWEFDRVPPSDHPTKKPVDLVVKAISNHKAETILDLFLGSGTTLIACEQLNRKCFGMEISEAYTAVCLERYFNLTGIEPKLIK
ncbi:MAG: DNA modification methylase [Aridibacter sp.]